MSATVARRTGHQSVGCRSNSAKKKPSSSARDAVGRASLSALSLQNITSDELKLLQSDRDRSGERPSALMRRCKARCLCYKLNR